MSWLKKLNEALRLGRKARRENPDDFGITDEHRMAVVRAAFETGKPVIGSVDEEGNLTMKVLGDEEE